MFLSQIMRKPIQNVTAIVLTILLLDLNAYINHVVEQVVGWGNTMDSAKPSEILLHSNLSVLDHDICKKALPNALVFDKFCGVKDSG